MSWKKLAQRRIFAAAPQLRFARLWFWIGVLLTASIILLSLINPPDQVKAVLLNDKLAHTLAYVVLMGWFAQIFHHRTARVVFVVIFVSMGIGIEFLQGMTPHRQFELLDMAANTTGVLLAWILTYTWMGSVLVWFERTFMGTRPQVRKSRAA